MGSGLNGIYPVLIKFVIPFILFTIVLTLIINTMKLAKTKVLFMSEVYHITPPRFELFKPFIVVYVYLTLCFLLPSQIMFLMVPLIFTLIVILHIYWETWKKYGFSIGSYIIIIAAVVILAIITGVSLHLLLAEIIIPYVGRFYNSVV
jgi:hypothetical protein